MAAFASGNIENEEQDSATRNVPEKIVAKPDISMRAFDESRNVRNRSATITVELDDADDGMKSREWVRRDLRMRRGDFSEQGRFTRVGIPDQRRVRHCPQFKNEMALLSFLAFSVLNWRAVLRAFEMHVTLAAAPAFAEDEFLVLVSEIGDGSVVLIGRMGPMGPIWE